MKGLRRVDSAANRGNVVKKIILAIALAASASAPALAQSTVRVDGYTRRDGTIVQPYERTAPNSTRTDNWSSQGNVNPNTGRAGTVDPYAPKAGARPKY
jgi:hypothetical protein